MRHRQGDRGLERAAAPLAVRARHHRPARARGRSGGLGHAADRLLHATRSAPRARHGRGASVRAPRYDARPRPSVLPPAPVPLRRAPHARLGVQTVAVLTPGAKYLVRVRGATKLSGVAADGQGVLVVPIPKPVAKATTKARLPPRPPR